MTVEAMSTGNHLAFPTVGQPSKSNAVERHKGSKHVTVKSNHVRRF